MHDLAKLRKIGTELVLVKAMGQTADHDDASVVCLG